MRCIPFSDNKRESSSDSFISAIKLEINVNEGKLCRRIKLKGLYGGYNRIQSFVTQFKADLFSKI